MKTKWTEGGVLLFPLPNREPKEDGGRRATNPYSRGNPLGGTDPAVVRGFCRLPRFMVTPGPVNSAVQNSPGNQHTEPPDQLGGTRGA
jgi:hypothetical protein